MRPRSSTSTRSASAAMKSRFCSTSRIDNPRDSLSRARICAMSSMIEGWIPSVGSSSRRSTGSPIRHRARARSCCSPPESISPVRSRSGSSLGKSISSAASAGPIVAVAVVPPREVEVLPHRQPRKDPPALRHVSDAEPRAFVRRQVGDVGPVLAHGSGVGRQEAHQGLEERGLPPCRCGRGCPQPRPRRHRGRCRAESGHGRTRRRAPSPPGR